MAIDQSRPETGGAA